MIKKIKLDFTLSLKLGPIIVDINNKKEKRKCNKCSSGDRTSNASISRTGNILSHHYMKFLFCTFLPLSFFIRPHTFLINTFFEIGYSLEFKLVLQNSFHGLSFTIVRLLSCQCVFLNFNLRLTASLRTLAIYK